MGPEFREDDLAKFSRLSLRLEIRIVSMVKLVSQTRKVQSDLYGRACQYTGNKIRISMIESFVRHSTDREERVVDYMRLVEAGRNISEAAISSRGTRM